MLGDAPNEKLWQMPDEKLDEGGFFATEPSSAQWLAHFAFCSGGSRLRGEKLRMQVLDYCAMVSGRGEADDSVSSMSDLFRPLSLTKLLNSWASRAPGSFFSRAFKLNLDCLTSKNLC
jgi:hypothetical protein